MTPGLVQLCLLLAGLAVSAALVPLMKRIAFRTAIVDKPGARKVHEVSKPLLGGGAVVLSTLLVVGGSALALKSAMLLERLGPAASWVASQRPLAQPYWVRLATILAGGVAVAVVGLLDDRMKERFPPGVKLAGQILAAAIAVAGGNRTEFLPHDWMNVAVSLLWVVGITNSFNLLDNMDGLSGGVALISSMVFYSVAAVQGQLFIACFLAAFMGALLGFLFYNFHPASIFMGDLGSLFIGFTLGTLTLVESYAVPGRDWHLAVLLPLVTLAVPLFDTASVIVIRWRAGKPIYVGDANHLSHRLVRMGMSQRGAVLAIYLLALSLGLSAMLLPGATPVRGAVVLCQDLAIVSLVALLMFFGERNGLKGAPPQELAPGRH